GFAGAGRAGQHHAFTRIDMERDTAHHGQLDATLQVHDKGLLGVGDVDHRSHWRAHAGKIEETSNWVYGSRGSSSTWSVSPVSLTRPPFITITRCDSSRATARSWVTTMAAR